MAVSRSSHQLTMTAWTYTFLVTFASFLCLCAADSAGGNKTITLVNNCAFSVWPAIVGSSDVPLPEVGEVQAGQSYSWQADPFWSGSIWGRTDCVFNSQGQGSCDTGDCGGNLQCNGQTGDVTAITKADFELLGGTAKPDTYSVTLENGYNLPLSAVASYDPNDISSSRPCDSMACTADAKTVCPTDLQETKAGSSVTACNGSFDGTVANPPEFGTAFQQACPAASPFQSSSICPPSTASYTLTFCASTSSP